MFEPVDRGTIRFIAVDWGSKNFRAYAIDEHGEIRQRAKAHQGIQRCKDDSYAQILRRLLGKWFNKYPNVPVLMSGMIGDTDGWQEVDCVEAPASIDDVAETVEKIINHRFERDIYIVPGVRLVDKNGEGEMIRGEEIQAFGMMQQFPGRSRYIICLPGSLTKWIEVVDGRIVDFHTFMTGEIYSFLTRQSALATSVEGVFHSPEATAKGIAVSQNSSRWLHDLYQVRALCAAHDIAPVEMSSYLSGLLIGSELKAAKELFPGLTEIFLAAAPWLMDVYQQAAEVYGLTVNSTKGEQITASGLFQIYERLALVPVSRSSRPRSNPLRESYDQSF